jgi:LysM repeat protein
MKRLVCACLLVASSWTLAAAQDATVDTVSVRVKDGDTLALLAAEYYGDRRKAIYIMVENKIVHARPLKPGERLKIPVNREITTSANETFETLAANYLGDARRGVHLAEFNNMSPDERIPAGSQIQIPFTLTHKAEGNEALAAIAATYFNDKSRGDMLRRYNFLEKTSLEKDESIQVPVFNVRIATSKMAQVDAEAKLRRETRRETQARATGNLPKAWQAWRSGDTKQINTLLSEIDIDYLDTNDAIDVALLLGLAACAENKKEAAQEHFKAVRARKETYVLRKFDYSPKILEQWTLAGGQTD